MQTKFLYLEDYTALDASAHVTNVTKGEGGTTIELDQTIFYPQGGGQPYDTGTIESSSGLFTVLEVRFVDGVVKHIGTFEKGSIQEGDEASLKVDGARRLLHARLHSGGHVVDLAVAQLQLPWTPGKGYHFPDGPYVEYHVSASDDVNAEQLLPEIERIANSVIAKGEDTKAVFMEKEEMHTVCRHVPEYIPSDKPARVVMYGDFGVPCGGTHVKSLKDVEGVTVRKIKRKGDTVRVSYAVT